MSFILVSFLCTLLGCSQQKPAKIDDALALYRQNKLEDALPLLEKLVSQEKDNAENHVWLAETYRRLGRKGDAVKTARQALALKPDNSFAHTIIAEATNPVLGEWDQANSDTTWFHLMKAIECDSTDGHPWLLVYGEGIHRGEIPMMHKALRSLVGSGFLTKAALSYGRWMLRALPKNAILLTNGDMDTYPPCAVHEVEGLRRDVVIVNRGTLETKWDARYIRDGAGVPLPIDDAQIERFEVPRDSQGNLVTLSDVIIRGWVEKKAKGFFGRPICAAVTVEERYLSTFKENMRFAGSFLEWHDAASATKPDTASMHASLEGLRPDDFAGAWVSDRDRSPIRRMYTKNLVRNVTETALVYAESLLKAKRIAEANRWIGWADELDRKAELGPVFTQRIAQLRENLPK
jgi:tetratricopeptide (TPR) repeat protein